MKKFLLMKENKLNAMKCNDCGHIRYPFRLFCNKCQSRNVSEFLMGPKGKLMSYTISYLKPMVGKIKVPYSYGVVRIFDGDSKYVDVLGVIESQPPFEDIKINEATEILPESEYIKFKMVGGV